MKNKGKKILAGVALGVMGAMALTGCSSSEQTTLDTAMNKADKLIEVIEEKNEQNKYSEALRLFEYGKARLMYNRDNVWDNLKMNITQCF